MRKKLTVLLFAIVLSAMVLSACAGAPSAVADKPVPAEYAGKTNPFAGQADAADAGKMIYTDNCASCHGDSGKGDGPAGGSLDPKPADLATLQSTKSDDFLNWVISEGGPANGKSASMVAWKGTLSEDEIWQVVAYLHTLK